MKLPIDRVVLEMARREQEALRWTPKDFLFEAQLGPFESEARYKCKRVGRRGGKSYGSAADLVDAAILWPKSTPLYVTTTRQDARDIMDPAFDLINTQFRLGMVQNKATGDITLPNGSRIMMRGAATMREINKLRGPAYPCVKVDEVQNFGPDLHYMIDEVLEPATAQFHKGVKPSSITVSGTPPPAQYGPFWEIDQGKYADAWAHFHWTFLDNPYIPEPTEFLRKVLERRGWTEDHPGYQREYLGLWVRDDEARAFRFEPWRDVIDTFDRSHALDWFWWMGIDVGYDDPCAFVVGAASIQLGRAYVVEEYEETELTATDALLVAERLCDTYPVNAIAVDSTGGGSKMIVEDWRKRSTLPFLPAVKSHKASQVAAINGDFLQGKIKINRQGCPRLVNDLMILEWDGEKKANNKFVYPKGARDHLPDAFQYGYNLCFHHFQQKRGPKQPEYLSPEWYAQEERAMEEWQVENAGEDGPGSPWDILEETHI